MKQYLQIIGLLFLFLPLFSEGQEKHASNLETTVSVQIKEGTLLDIFNEISAQTGIFFSYDPKLVNTQKPISVTLHNQPVQQVLALALGNQLSFKLLKNQLVITTNELDIIPDTDMLPPPIVAIKLSGSVINRNSEESISYVSISIFGKAFGTITNLDGEFELKIPAQYESDTLIISCMGFAQKLILLDTLQLSEVQISLQPIKIKLKEVKVTAINALQVMDSMIENINKNYAEQSQLMNAFYREILKQDKKYVNVSEAILTILKAPYNTNSQDRIRYLKGRKSPNIQAFQYVDFKMQGGPYYITKLDVIKTLDSFIDKEFRHFYNYTVDQLIQYLDHPTYIIKFKPRGKIDYLTYEGKLFIDKETFALVHAEFSLSRNGKKSARKSLIRKKPKGFYVRPIKLDYRVSYKRSHGKWNLATAQTSVKFHVKSKHDRINSVFHSISDLLITDHQLTNLKRFNRRSSINSSDIFTEIITEYDDEFWGDYTIIQANEDLRNALKKDTFTQTKTQAKK